MEQNRRTILAGLAASAVAASVPSFASEYNEWPWQQANIVETITVEGRPVAIYWSTKECMPVLAWSANIQGSKYGQMYICNENEYSVVRNEWLDITAESVRNSIAQIEGFEG